MADVPGFEPDLNGEHQLCEGKVEGPMAPTTKVLIHSQGDSEGSLKHAIDHYRPRAVVLISNPDSKASRISDWIKSKNENLLGVGVRGIDHAHLINIEAFKEDSVLRMIKAVEEAKKWAFSKLSDQELEFYAGVAGGTKLMVVGMALAAIQGDMTSYYVLDPTHAKENNGNYILEIGFMNDVMSITNWLKQKKQRLPNLEYLRVIQRRELDGRHSTSKLMSRSQRDTLDESDEPLTLQRTQDNITKQLNQMSKKGLVAYDETLGKNPKHWLLTDLGRFILSMHPDETNSS
jgi:hypothetical protein